MISIGTNKEVYENGTCYIRQNYKIVFVGNNEVGKTSLINKYFYNEDISTVKPTEGIEMKAVNIKLKSKGVRLIIWDVSGNSQYSNLIDLHIKETFSLFLVYDITNKASFNSIKEYLHKAILMKGNDTNMLIVLIGTKSDLTSQRVITEKEAFQFANELKIIHVETSSVNANGLEALKGIFENALNLIIQHDKVAIDNTICSLI